MSASDNLNFSQFKSRGLSKLSKIPDNPNPHTGEANTGVIDSRKAGFRPHTMDDPAVEHYFSHLDRIIETPAVRKTITTAGGFHTTQQGLHRETVAGYLSGKNKTNELPQVTVVGGKKWVDDSHHRIAAYTLGGAKSFEAMVREVK